MHIGSDHLIDVFHLSHPHRLISNRRMSQKPEKILEFCSPCPDDQDLDGVAEALEQTLISLYQNRKKGEHIFTKLTHTAHTHTHTHTQKHTQCTQQSTASNRSFWDACEVWPPTPHFKVMWSKVWVDCLVKWERYLRRKKMLWYNLQKSDL